MSDEKDCKTVSLHEASAVTVSRMLYNLYVPFVDIVKFRQIVFSHPSPNEYVMHVPFIDDASDKTKVHCNRAVGSDIKSMLRAWAFQIMRFPARFCAHLLIDKPRGNSECFLKEIEDLEAFENALAIEAAMATTPTRRILVECWRTRVEDYREALRFVVLRETEGKIGRYFQRYSFTILFTKVSSYFFW